eukprot:295182-Prorocentrum_lima.AAC.1
MHDPDTTIPHRIKWIDGNMVGIVKTHIRRVLLAAAELGPSYWPYAAMYVAGVMRHNSTGRLW